MLAGRSDIFRIIYYRNIFVYSTWCCFYLIIAVRFQIRHGNISGIHFLLSVRRVQMSRPSSMSTNVSICETTAFLGFNSAPVDEKPACAVVAELDLQVTGFEQRFLVWCHAVIVAFVDVQQRIRGHGNNQSGCFTLGLFRSCYYLKIMLIPQCSAISRCFVQMDGRGYVTAALFVAPLQCYPTGSSKTHAHEA